MPFDAVSRVWGLVGWGCMVGFSCAWGAAWGQTMQLKLSTSFAAQPQIRSEAVHSEAARAAPDPAAVLAIGTDYVSTLVELAVTTHPSVQSKAAEVLGARATVDAAKWQYYPTPSVIAERGANQTKKDVGTSANAAVTGTTTLRLQQPLWSGGRIAAGVRVSELKALAAQAAVNESRMAVALKTVDAWQALLVAFGREQIAIKNVVQLTHLRDMMNRRVAQQVSPPVEAELSQSRLVQAQAEKATVQASKETALHRLAQWVGDLRSAKPALTDALLAQVLVEAGIAHAGDAEAVLVGGRRSPMRLSSIPRC